VTLWTPANLTTPPIGWWKADSLSLNDGDPIPSLSDSSGSGHTMSQGTVAQQPLYKAAIQNALPVVRFDGSNDTLFGTLVTTNRTDFAVIGAHKLTSGMVFGNGTGGNGYGYFINGGNRSIDYAFVADLDDGANSGVFELVAWQRTGGTTTMRVNGTSQSLTNSGSTPSDPTGGTTSLGSRGASELFGAADLGELLFLSPAPSSSDLQIIEGYLAWKWGLQANLPANHPYFAAAPTIGVAGDDEHSIALAQRSANNRWLVPQFYGTEEIMPLLEGPGIITGTHARVGHGPRILAKLSTAPRIRARLVLEPQK
jgi:hypothetical protein